MKRVLLKSAVLLLVVTAVAVFMAAPAAAAIGPGLVESADIGGGAGSVDPNITISVNGEGSDIVRIILLMTVLAVLPSIIIMMTSFTRIVIVFSLTRNALGLQQTPPNQVLIGLALFLSLFIMQPVLVEINQNAYQPYSQGQIDSMEFLEEAQAPLRTFMLRQTKQEDLNMFLNISGRAELPEAFEEYSMTVVVPAFITSELKRAFTIGFLIFIPFLIIDMVVASALMSMGMMMLPPATISLPFKLMLFILVDGWTLIIRTLLATYI